MNNLYCGTSRSIGRTPLVRLKTIARGYTATGPLEEVGG